MEAIIKQLTEQHPEGVAQLLRAYGYEAEPTAKNLLNLVRVHGNKPLPFSNTTDDSKKKPTLAEAISGGLLKLGRVLIAAKGGAVPALPKVVVGPNGVIPADETAPSPRILGVSSTLFLALAALTLIALAIILFKEK
ncbi:MAG: hypothetical protein H7Y13_02335 [Sphingobacteriaceae bacterium]|nr:hypothetical protein [Sphingobacteriaceae bacterium]